MMQFKQQPKKVKGARKKARQEVIERLQLKYPTWFEGKTDKEIKNLVTAFRLSGKEDDEFQTWCIEYEAELERLRAVREYNPYISGQPVLFLSDPLKFIKTMRDATPKEEQSVEDYLKSISVDPGINFNDYLGGE